MRSPLQTLCRVVVECLPPLLENRSLEINCFCDGIIVAPMAASYTQVSVPMSESASGGGLSAPESQAGIRVLEPGSGGSVQALSWLLYFQAATRSTMFQVTLACRLLPTALLLAKHVFKLFKRMILALHAWWLLPPRWTAQLGTLHLKLPRAPCAYPS